MFDMNKVLPLQGWTMDTFDEKSKATIEKMLQEEQYPFCTIAMYCLCVLSMFEFNTHIITFQNQNKHPMNKSSRRKISSVFPLLVPT